MSPLHVQQDATYAGDGYWKWSVWLEGAPADLDQISYVDYTLDASFPDPVRRIRDRESRFKLAAAGWGEFTMYLKVVFRDGSRYSLDHQLRLVRNVEAPAPR